MEPHEVKLTAEAHAKLKRLDRDAQDAVFDCLCLLADNPFDDCRPSVCPPHPPGYLIKCFNKRHKGRTHFVNFFFDVIDCEKEVIIEVAAITHGTH